MCKYTCTYTYTYKYEDGHGHGYGYGCMQVIPCLVDGDQRWLATRLVDLPAARMSMSIRAGLEVRRDDAFELRDIHAIACVNL